MREGKTDEKVEEEIECKNCKAKFFPRAARMNYGMCPGCNLPVECDFKIRRKRRKKV